MIGTSSRQFAAFVDPEGVWLIEYRREKTGYRIVRETRDLRLLESARDAFRHLTTLLHATEAKRGSISVVLNQFGVFHHTMTLPVASKDVLVPVIRREVQRLFNATDPVLAFNWGDTLERRSGDRADAKTAPRQVLIAGAPKETVDALTSELASTGIRIRNIAVVADALRRIMQAAALDSDPAALVVCPISGPQAAFFIDGHLALALDPPIALESDAAMSSATIVSHVERGVVYLRQQFRGAEPRRIYLSTRSDQAAIVAEALGDRFGVPIQPVMPQVSSPGAVLALGGVMDADSGSAIDLFPHPPTRAERMRGSFTGSNGTAMAVVTAAAVASIWAVSQLTGVRRDTARLAALHDQVAQAMTEVTPLRQSVEQRKGLLQRVAVADDVYHERQRLVTNLASLSAVVPATLRFDSLVVTRAAAGWTSSIVGSVAGESLGASVRALNDFYGALSRMPGVTAPSLDHFDYAGVAPVDTLRKASTATGVQFRISFTAPAPGAAK